MLQGFEAYCDFNNVESLEKCIADCKANGEQVVGVWFELVQGEGGVNVPADNYLSCVRKICDKNKILMILDEVQSGAGRTGELFAFSTKNSSRYSLNCKRNRQWLSCGGMFGQRKCC